MNFLDSLEPWLAVLQVIAALAVITLVLLQQGKGADMGAAFGSGSAGSLFGAAGAANFFSRMTKWAAIVFFACTLGLVYIHGANPSSSTSDNQHTGVMQGFTPTKAPTAEPSAPALEPSAPSTTGSETPTNPNN